ncbi:VRR-NUC domain-containing protein [Pseudomonas aeruginosa]|uniref:VRR-NUC domain-containing protein n=1 Tax=Pseudomonas aeruginosa TaxID=287 RepID=UPI001F441261|nr:VRR-NUC domain-containing protein [Pseudomonas aeruginosa]
MARRLGELDEILQGRSRYKPEVSYDMTKNPPQPILDSQAGNSPHGWIPGWNSKYWDEDPEHPPFKPGKGMIRRPDLIIVQNPNRPPTQDNIKQVVEMKFPPAPH